MKRLSDRLAALEQRDEGETYVVLLPPDGAAFDAALARGDEAAARAVLERVSGTACRGPLAPAIVIGGQ